MKCIATDLLPDVQRFTATFKGSTFKGSQCTKVNSMNLLPFMKHPDSQRGGCDKPPTTWESGY